MAQIKKDALVTGSIPRVMIKKKTVSISNVATEHVERNSKKTCVAQQDDVTVLGPHWCDFVWATAHGLL